MEFTVAAFNCHWGVGRFGEYRRKPYDVPRVVASFDADIVVVPESVRRGDGRNLLDPLVDQGYYVECTELMQLDKRRDRRRRRDLVPRFGAWEIGICTRFPVLQRREIEIGSFRADPVGKRRALALTVEIDGRPVEIVGLHTSSRFYTLAGLRHLYTLKQQIPVGGPQIIAGDYNFWGPPVGVLMPGWTRPVRGRTYPAHRPHSQIDHILVRGGLDVISGEVLAETPSDHRPVRARLRLLP